MWSIRLNMDRIEEWASKALELAAPGSRRGRVPFSRWRTSSYRRPGESSRKRPALADELDSVELRSFALGAKTQAAFDDRRFQEAAASASSDSQLMSEIDDPDHLCEAYEAGSPAAAAVCRFDEAGRLAELHGGLSQRLSAHHRVHSVSLELELADAIGDWVELAAQTDRTVAAIEANLATPCVRNPRDLLLLRGRTPVPGRRAAGDRAGARRPPHRRRGVRDLPQRRATPDRARARRPSVARVARSTLPVERALVWGPGIFAARLDALVALDRTSGSSRKRRRSCKPGRRSSHSRCARWVWLEATTICSRVRTSASRRSASSGTLADRAAAPGV